MTDQTSTASLKVVQDAVGTYVEGPAGRAFLRKLDDVNRVIEICFGSKAKAALLYAANMTPNFFDLSSGEAGAILQKLRNYQIRVALVCPPGEVQSSSRFGELMAEENRQPYFRFFESVDAARAWLMSN